MRDGGRATSGEAETRTLGWAYLCAGLVAIATAIVPFSATAPTALAAVLGVVAVSIGCGLLLVGAWVPPWARHVLLLVTSTAMSGCILASTTAAGRVVTSYSYLWVAVYTAWFHRRGVASAHLAAIGAGFALGLVGSHAPAPLQTWGFVMASIAGVAVVLNTLVQRLRELAERDQLTGLLTRRAFADVAARHMDAARRSGRPLTLALIDLDGFKVVNDRDGHAAGDRLLVELASAWRGVLRRGDVLGRHGGDEFILLFPAADEAETREMLERLRTASTAGRWTAGVAGWRGEDLSRWTGRADLDLYAAKAGRRTGRDPVAARTDADLAVARMGAPAAPAAHMPATSLNSAPVGSAAWAKRP